jgi:hypothetical protein
MGDRTTVTLVVRNKDVLENPEIFEDADDSQTHGLLTTLTYYESNYGSLDFEDVLQDKKIPYDKTWDNGRTFSEGTEYCRIGSSGMLEIKEFSANTEGSINVNEALKAYKQGNIESFLNDKKIETTVISWDEQEAIIEALATSQPTMAVNPETIIAVAPVTVIAVKNNHYHIKK